MSEEKRLVPYRRFKGFTDDWEQRKLGEISEQFSGGTPLVGNSEYYNGEIPFIRSSEINSDKTELYITKLGLEKSSSKLVDKGTILYALYGATSGEVGISKLSGAINQAILAIVLNDNFDKIFVSENLKKEKKNIIGKFLQGVQGNLSGNIIKELTFLFPNLKEQKSIAALLNVINENITLHQREYFIYKLA